LACTLSAAGTQKAGRRGGHAFGTRSPGAKPGITGVSGRLGQLQNPSGAFVATTATRRRAGKAGRWRGQRKNRTNRIVNGQPHRDSRTDVGEKTDENHAKSGQKQAQVVDFIEYLSS